MELSVLFVPSLDDYKPSRRTAMKEPYFCLVQSDFKRRKSCSSAKASNSETLSEVSISTTPETSPESDSVTSNASDTSDASNTSDTPIERGENGYFCPPCDEIPHTEKVVDGIVYKFLGCSGKAPEKRKTFVKIGEVRPKNKQYKGVAYEIIMDDEGSCTGYKCNYCNEIKTSTSKIQMHTLNHYELRYSCQFCTSSFSNPQGKQQHYSYECSICKKHLKGGSLKKHTDQHK